MLHALLYLLGKCYTPPTMTNAYYPADITTYEGSVVFYTCETRFTLVGVSDNSTCMASGVWIGPDFECIRKFNFRRQLKKIFKQRYQDNLNFCNFFVVFEDWLAWNKDLMYTFSHEEIHVPIEEYDCCFSFHLTCLSFCYLINKTFCLKFFWSSVFCYHSFESKIITCTKNEKKIDVNIPINIFQLTAEVRKLCSTQNQLYITVHLHHITPYMNVRLLIQWLVISIFRVKQTLNGRQKCLSAVVSKDLKCNQLYNCNKC